MTPNAQWSELDKCVGKSFSLTWLLSVLPMTVIYVPPFHFSGKNEMIVGEFLSKYKSCISTKMWGRAVPSCLPGSVIGKALCRFYISCCNLSTHYPLLKQLIWKKKKIAEAGLLWFIKSLNISKLASNPNLYLSMNERLIQSGFWGLENSSWHTQPHTTYCVRRWEKKILIVLLTSYFETSFILWLSSDVSNRYKKQMQIINPVHYGGSSCLICNTP